ncbi:MAG: FAD:protein FMN transferase [Spirochaetaceae bacterium]|nr:FAD:protein FMN transferase [Spirochaetaceae bacterium]MCF7948067.1 FAD:protein FMN transferase [Spirochaetia bacterium]MCF7950428.1 FAD:protein FMN transferase [Spirochaetaceae bacterium]
MLLFNSYRTTKKFNGKKMCGGLLLSAFLILAFSSCQQSSPERISETDFALGTTCSVQLYGTQYKDKLAPALAIATEIEDKMSAHTEDSEVAEINRKAGDEPVEVSEETFNLIARAKEFSAIGNGVFDLTVGPLVELWDIGSGEETVPDAEQIEAALQKVNYKDIELIPAGQRSEEGNEKVKRPRVYLQRPGMRIDLGAIAKGYAADRMVEYLKSQGVEYGIVNLGGNVYAFGEKHNNSVWKIGIQSPEDARGNYLGVVELVDKAVVTSGKYERYFIEDGVRYHHILDTEDGFPIEKDLASVSIISADATEADALSTLVFGLGLEKGLEFTEQRPGVDSILVTEDNTVFTTSGLRTSFELTDKDFKRGESRALTNQD